MRPAAAGLSGAPALSLCRPLGSLPRGLLPLVSVCSGPRTRRSQGFRIPPLPRLLPGLHAHVSCLEPSGRLRAASSFPQTPPLRVHVWVQWVFPHLVAAPSFTLFRPKPWDGLARSGPLRTSCGAAHRAGLSSGSSQPLPHPHPHPTPRPTGLPGPSGRPRARCAPRLSQG